MAMLLKVREYPKTMLAWVGISLAIMLTHVLLPKPLAFDFTALLLAVIGAVYVGFALADGRPGVMVQEISAASFFVLLAALGLWVNPYLWVLGLFLHGVWDWLHHPGGVKTRVPDYYPPVCVIVDGSLALFLLVWLSLSA